MTTGVKGTSRKLAGALEDLGLTPLEGEVYAFLVRESPATGYRIAQAVGKPVGNIYKAVEALEQKGAVFVGEAEGNRMVRAVAPRELVARLGRNFRDACATAVEQLKPAEDDEPDDLLYRIVDREAFFERCRSVVRNAERFVLVSACPVLVDELAADFEAAAASGVPVVVKVYSPAVIKGVDTVLDPRGLAAVETGPGQWIELTADGSVFVQGLLDHEGRELHTGHWTCNPLINWAVYTGRYADIVLAAVTSAVESGASAQAQRAVLDRFDPFGSPVSAGKMRLVSRYRRPSPAGRRR